jgi:P4 family phage/plasmid primase-like protien
MTAPTALSVTGQAALDYVRRGWWVFPVWWPGADGRCCCDRSCTSVAKHPVGWLVPRGVHDASNDVEQVKRWWRRAPSANIAIAAGPRSGLLVLDVDPRNGGDVTIERLCREYGTLGEPLRVRTGGGGQHLYYAHPPTMSRGSGRLFGPGIDVKSADGPVVAAPSMHASGQRYEWLDDWTRALGALPEWMVELLDRAEQRAHRQPCETLAGAVARTPSHPYLAAVVRAETSALAETSKGARHRGLYDASRRLGQLVGAGALAPDDITESLLESCEANGALAEDGEKECRRTIRDGIRDGAAQPRDLAHVRELRCHHDGGGSSAGGQGGAGEPPVQGPTGAEEEDVPAPLREHILDQKLTQTGLRDAVMGFGEVRCIDGYQLISWQGSGWNRDHAAVCEISARLDTISGVLASEAQRLTTLDPDRAKALHTHARLAASARGRSDVRSLLAQHGPCAVSRDDIDANPDLMGLACGNVLALDCWPPVVRPATPDDLITRRVRASWDPDAQAPLWDHYLRTVQPDPNMREYLQRCAAYVLRGDNTEHATFFLTGDGGTGKSTFAGTLLHVLGDYGGTVAPSVLVSDNLDAGDLASLAKLYRARLVTLSETDEWIRHVNAETIKRIVSTDMIEAKFMRQNPFSFVPTFKLMLFMNGLPSVTDTSDGFWRRVHPIPFDQKLVRPKGDDHLEAKLRGGRKHPGEVNGIFQWMVGGIRGLLERGLEQPTLISEKSAQWRATEDRLGEFVADYCDLDPEYEVDRTTLYSVYEAWADKCGIKPLGIGKLYTQLEIRWKVKERRPQSADGAVRVRLWKGIALAKGVLALQWELGGYGRW